MKKRQTICNYTHYLFPNMGRNKNNIVIFVLLLKLVSPYDRPENLQRSINSQRSFHLRSTREGQIRLQQICDIFSVFGQQSLSKCYQFENMTWILSLCLVSSSKGLTHYQLVAYPPVTFWHLNYNYLSFQRYMPFTHFYKREMSAARDQTYNALKSMAYFAWLLKR